MSVYMSSSQAEQALIDLWTANIDADMIPLDESESIHARTTRRGDAIEHQQQIEEKRYA